jgi:hypothetical protein
MRTEESKKFSSENASREASEPPAVSADVMKFMATAGIRLVGWDETRPGRFILWRRQPMAQGDATTYEFSTPVGITFDAYFQVTLADSIYYSGVRAGRRALRRELSALLHGDERNEII